MKHSKCLALKSDSENSLICSFLDSPPPLLPQVWAFDSIHLTEWKWSSTRAWVERSSFAFATTAAIFDPCGCGSWGCSCSCLPCCGCPIFSSWAVFHSAVPSGFLTSSLQRRLFPLKQARCWGVACSLSRLAGRWLHRAPCSMLLPRQGAPQFPGSLKLVQKALDR